MRRALVVLAFLLVVPAAHADAPAGFHESLRLDAAASALVGRPIAVYCGLPRYGSGYADGLALVNGSAMELDDETSCRPLESAARGRRPTQDVMGRALLSFVHETEHLRGVADESAADCSALRELSSDGIRYFRLRGQRGYLHGMMESANGFHSSRPDQYRTLC